MIRTTTGAVVMLAAGAALGQNFGTAQFWWEASADDGATWSRDVLEVEAAQPSVRVRAWTAWEPGAGQGVYQYFASCSFDVIVEGINGAGQADTASELHRTRYLDSLPHPMAAMRFGDVLKIDDERDTLPPGEGTRWLRFSQPPANIPGWEFQFQNPITLFSFVLELDGTEGERIVHQVFRPHAGAPGDPPRYFLQTYTSETGLGNYPDGEGGVFDLRIRVVPAPAAAALLVLAAFCPRRRRR